MSELAIREDTTEKIKFNYFGKSKDEDVIDDRLSIFITSNLPEDVYNELLEKEYSIEKCQSMFPPYDEIHDTVFYYYEIKVDNNAWLVDLLDYLSDKFCVIVRSLHNTDTGEAQLYLDLTEYDYEESEFDMEEEEE